MLGVACLVAGDAVKGFFIQAYFTATALANIAEATVASLAQFAGGEALVNEVTLKQVAKGK